MFSSAIRETHFISLISRFINDLNFTFAMVRKGKEAAAPVEEHPGGGHITVTAQQSRYALDAIDAPASKEVRREIIS